MNTVTPIIDLGRLRRRESIGPAPTNAARAATAVLVVHSDPVVSAGLGALLTRTRGFCVTVLEPEVLSVPGAGSIIDGVVVADYNSGLRLIEADAAFGERMLILTDSASQAKIRHALQQGVRGYLLSGCSLAEILQGIRVVHNGGVALDPLVARRITDTINQRALTAKEEAILRLMMLGLSNKRIARSQDVAEGTVKTHVKSILAKLNVASRTQAVIVAQRRGLVEESDGDQPDEGPEPTTSQALQSIDT